MRLRGNQRKVGWKVFPPHDLLYNIYMCAHGKAADKGVWLVGMA